MQTRGAEERAAALAKPGKYRQCPWCTTPRWIPDADPNGRKAKCWMERAPCPGSAGSVKCRCEMTTKMWRQQRVVAREDVPGRCAAVRAVVSESDGAGSATGRGASWYWKAVGRRTEEMREEGCASGSRESVQ
eukprot:7853510-Alexandrium_andersonii.AAC.1